MLHCTKNNIFLNSSLKTSKVQNITKAKHGALPIASYKNFMNSTSMSSPMIVLLNRSISMLVLKPHGIDNVMELFGG
jgi:hypothetical protein